MIIFTITNSITDQVYVGSTRNSIDNRWEEILVAAESGLEHPLFDDIREHSPQQFAIAEWAIAEDLQDMRELTREAIEIHNAVGLQGMRTTAPVVKAPRKSAKKERTEDLSISDAATSIFNSRNDLVTEADNALDGIDNFDGLEFSSEDKQTDVSENDQPKDKPVNREKSLKEMAQERDAQLVAKIAKEKAEALEMAKLMARMDARKRGTKSKTKTAASKTTRTANSKPAATTSSAPKLSTGKVASATQEKKIKEGIEQEREARQAAKLAQQKAEAQEMAAIMARIDGRAKSMRKTKPKVKKTLSLKQKKTATESPDRSPALPQKTAPIPERNMEKVLEQTQLTKQDTVPASNKFATAIRERKIRETIAREKAARQQQQESKQTAQVSQLNALQARLAARAASKSS